MLDSTGRTKLTPFRLTAQTLAEIDHLIEHFGAATRAAVVRQVVHAAARKAGFSPNSQGKNNSKKIQKKT